MTLKLEAVDGTGSVQVFPNAKFTTTIMVDNPHGVAYVALTDEQVAQLHEFTAPKDEVKEDSDPPSHTLGDITGNDLGTTHVEFSYYSSSIYGIVSEVTYAENPIEGPRAWRDTRITLRVGGITLENLPLSTPCRLLRISKA